MRCDYLFCGVVLSCAASFSRPCGGRLRRRHERRILRNVVRISTVVRVWKDSGGEYGDFILIIWLIRENKKIDIYTVPLVLIVALRNGNFHGKRKKAVLKHSALSVEGRQQRQQRKEETEIKSKAHSTIAAALCTRAIMSLSRRSSRTLNLEQYEILLAQAESEIRSSETDLEEARELMQKAGLSTEGELSKATTAASTGGHSNTDHFVALTGDYTYDRIAELRRRYLVRQRAEQPESRGEERWDKPRVPGERRRRIVREKDLPTAPPEPPLSGYIVFLGQMTTKLRHDRPDEPHDQSKVMQEISRMWRMALSDRDRKYYNDFSDECRYVRELISKS